MIQQSFDQMLKQYEQSQLSFQQRSTFKEILEKQYPYQFWRDVMGKLDSHFLTKQLHKEIDVFNINGEIRVLLTTIANIIHKLPRFRDYSIPEIVDEYIVGQHKCPEEILFFTKEEANYVCDQIQKNSKYIYLYSQEFKEIEPIIV